MTSTVPARMAATDANTPAVTAMMTSAASGPMIVGLTGPSASAPTAALLSATTATRQPTRSSACRMTNVVAPHNANVSPVPLCAPAAERWFDRPATSRRKRHPSAWPDALPIPTKALRRTWVPGSVNRPKWTVGRRRIPSAPD
jgi:hypothetical protein